MRILVVGAGATGGYFGGRLLQAGRDVTFLVRPERAARLAETGLVIASDYGDVTLPAPPTILASRLHAPYDVILLSCKSYDLGSAIDAFAPAIGTDSAVIPLLNGMRHVDVLEERLGPEHVLGGLCIISSRLDAAGRIVHLNDAHTLTFGARLIGQGERAEKIASVFTNAVFEARLSRDILLEMWEKWVAIGTLAGINCLMRSGISDIVAAGGTDLSMALLEECRSIAALQGRDPRPSFLEVLRRRLQDAQAPLIASMLVDLERGGPTEADHILGDLLRQRGEVPAPDHSLLRIAYTAVKAAEHRLTREKTPG